MTKRRVLEIFAANAQWMTPDELRIRLQSLPQRSSVYSYLSRLHQQQGLLERGLRSGRIVYRISPKGRERLAFFRSQDR
jgi:DNA-binding PadR family transcriptional regulator